MGSDEIVLLPYLDIISTEALYMLHFSYKVLNTCSSRLTLTFSFAGSWRDLLPVTLINPCGGKTLPTTSFLPYIATFRKTTPKLNKDFPVLCITTKSQTFIFMEIQISLLMDYVCTVRLHEHYQSSSCAQVFLTIAVNTINGCRPSALWTVVL